MTYYLCTDFFPLPDVFMYSSKMQSMHSCKWTALHSCVIHLQVVYYHSFKLIF